MLLGCQFVQKVGIGDAPDGFQFTRFAETNNVQDTEKLRYFALRADCMGCGYVTVADLRSGG